MATDNIRNLQEKVIDGRPQSLFLRLNTKRRLWTHIGADHRELVNKVLSSSMITPLRRLETTKSSRLPVFFRSGPALASSKKTCPSAPTRKSNPKISKQFGKGRNTADSSARAWRVSPTMRRI